MSSSDNRESADRCQFSDDVAQALDFFCGENFQSNRECMLCGEDVTALWIPCTLRGPETTRRSRSAVEDLIRQRIGCSDLKNILLLLTAVEFPSEQKNCQTVHCYRLDSRSHLGVTTLTQDDVCMIECYHGPDNYSIVYCTGYIAPEDAARNTPIKGEVFEIVQKASKAVRTTWYRGHVVRLAYRCIDRSNIVGVSPPKRNIFGIRALERPKIPVRMQSHVAFGASAESARKSQRLRLRGNLQREFHYTSQQNLDNTNFKPNDSHTRSTDPRQDAGSIPKDTPELKVDIGGPFPCEHLGFNFEKVGQPQKKPTQIKESDDLELNLRSTVREKLAKLAPTKKITKSGVRVSQLNDSKELSPAVEPDGVQMLMQPRELRDSSGHTALLTSTTSHFDSVIHQSSSTFICATDPLMLPPRFSTVALWHLERRLLNPSVRVAFSKLGHLVGQINERPCPQDEHLQRFFKLAELLDFKMYVRQESNFPGWPPVKGPRYRVECYVFDDRREYLASICLLQSQLRAMARLFPKARRNFRFVDNAFDLTPMPPTLTKWLKAILEAVNARPVYDLLGELTLDYARPPAAAFELNGNLAAVGK